MTIRIKDVTYWKISPGENAKYWTLWKKNNFIAMGWDYLLFELPKKEREKLLKTKNKKLFLERLAKVRKIKRIHERVGPYQLWFFLYEMKIGDIILANKGKKEFIGVGVITSSPVTPTSSEIKERYYFIRYVKWLFLGRIAVPEYLRNHFTCALLRLDETDVNRIPIPVDIHDFSALYQEDVPELVNSYEENINEEDLDVIIQQLGTKETSKESRTVSQFIRSKRLTMLLKKRFNYKCQVCGSTFETKNHGFYCETHHIIPLSQGGTDSPENILVLCPTCHKKFHYGSEQIVSDMIRKILQKNYKYNYRKNFRKLMKDFKSFRD